MTPIDPDFTDAEFVAQMDALRRRYLEGLPARRTAFVDAWRDCADNGDDSAWQRLRDVAHKLSGSAPCYGLEALGLVARELDKRLSGRAPCRERAIVEPLVVRMQALLDEAIQPA